MSFTGMILMLARYTLEKKFFFLQFLSKPTPQYVLWIQNSHARSSYPPVLLSYPYNITLYKLQTKQEQQKPRGQF